MIAVFCGSESWTDRDATLQTMRAFRDQNKLVEVIQGDAPGSDLITDSCARELGISVRSYHSSWETSRRVPGHLRNDKMLHMLRVARRKNGQSVCTIAFHEGPNVSGDTYDMLMKSMVYGIQTFIWLENKPGVIHVSRETKCRKCKISNLVHPKVLTQLNSDGAPYLHMLCNGKLGNLKPMNVRRK